MRLLLLLLLKADFYLQLNAEPQRPSSKEDGSSTEAHTQKNVHLDEQWLTTTMYVSVHFYNGKKPFEVFLSIFVICCQECCKKHSDVEETKTTIFQNLLNFQKQAGHTHTEKTLILGDRKLEHYKKWGLKASIISGSIPTNIN